MNEAAGASNTKTIDRVHQKRMERIVLIKAIASILATLAVPIIIAVAGWQIQTTISKESVRKDYVQMAIGILSSKDAKSDLPLRKWSVALLKQSSPVPFNDEVGNRLAAPSVIAVSVPTYVPIPSELAAPCKIAKPKDNTVRSAVEVAIERRFALEQCNDELAAIRAIQGTTVPKSSAR